MKHDVSAWPLALTVSRGQPSLDELQDYSAAWTGWLQRGERFATLKVFADAAAYTHPRGGGQERKAWFVDQGEQLREQVLAMATVAPPEVVAKINRIKSEGLYGPVPAQAFTTVLAATQWLREQAGLDALDADALQALVTELASAA